MDKEAQLYAEEQRKQLIEFNKNAQLIIKAVNELKAALPQPLSEVDVQGEVTVKNQPDSLDIRNIAEFTKGLELLGMVVRKAIEDNSYAPLNKITVENLSEIEIPKTISIKNFQDIEKFFADVVEAIKTNQPVVHVEKQALTFPKLAKDAIPVRLSDGKKFYEAIFNAVTEGAAETDPLVGYQPSDVDDASNPSYFGFVKKGGWWYIMQSNSGAFRYVRGQGNYAQRWTDRALLEYNYFFEVF